MKMKYVSDWTQFILTPSTTQVWEWNNLFDLDDTGVGHQPMYYDEMSLQYAENSVPAAKIMVEIINQTDTPVESWVIATRQKTAFTAAQPLELARAMHVITLQADAGGQIKRLFMYASYGKTMGTRINTRDNAAASGGNVVASAYFQVKHESIDGSSNMTLFVRTTLVCYTKWFHSKIVDQTGS